MLVRAGRDGAPANDWPGLLMFGGGLCFLAVCSGYYHASLNSAGTETANGVLRAFLDKDPATNKEYLRCLPSAAPEVPQLLDIVGVYAALIALFLYGVESACKKEIKDAASGWAQFALGFFGLVLPLAAVVTFGLVAEDRTVGGPFAGVLFALMLAALSAPTVVRVVVSTRERPKLWMVWLLWGLTLIAWAAVSYIIKPRLHWDSTWVFVVMMGFIGAVLGVNWSLSKNPLPKAELLILGIVFILGVMPRLLDGYGFTDPTISQPQTVFRKDFCSPKGIVQAHAVWHIMSAFALALTYDLLEKSRPIDESPRATILLPQGRELADQLAQPTLRQSLTPILIKCLLSAVAILMFVVALVSHEHEPLVGLVGSAIAMLLSLWLWLWPLGSK